MLSDPDTPTPKAQEGTWTLTAPDGRTWRADSPLKACGMEQRERVPASVALARIYRELDAPAEGAMDRPKVSPDPDAARLDWLQAQWQDGMHAEVCAKGDGTTWHAMRPAASVFVGPETFTGETLRAAIDAAMGAERTKPASGATEPVSARPASEPDQR